MMPTEAYDGCPIWQACRATSAATTLFDPVTIGPLNQTFADGAIAYNNPVRLVYREAQQLWPNRMNDALLVTIGTGAAPGPSLEGNLWKMIETMKKIVTETEKTNNDFFHDHSDMLDADRLYRFNVLHRLSDIGLEEYKEIRKVAEATQSYLNDGELRSRYRRCLTELQMILEGEVYTVLEESLIMNSEDFS
jgi:predicted acylesterase/phospholipase RssA